MCEVCGDPMHRDGTLGSAPPLDDDEAMRVLRDFVVGAVIVSATITLLHWIIP